MPILLPRSEIWMCLLRIGRASTATASTAQSCRKPKITTLQIMFPRHQALHSIFKVHIKPLLSLAIYVPNRTFLCHSECQREAPLFRLEVSRLKAKVEQRLYSLTADFAKNTFASDQAMSSLIQPIFASVAGAQAHSILCYS